MRTTTTTTLALVPIARYTSDARADAVSRGLAVRTRAEFAPSVLLEIEGSAIDAKRWISEQHGTADFKREATTLVLCSLESYGAEALSLAERARALVGVDGIDEIASTLADANDVETAWTIRGALAALLGDECPEIGGAYESEAREGFDFVALGGFSNVWGS